MSVFVFRFFLIVFFFRRGEELHNMFVEIFLVVCVSSLQLSESLNLQIEGNKTSFTFPLAITSEIKFYVHNEDDFSIYVQHKAAEKDSYDTICIVYQSASKGCITSNNICRCPTDTDGAFSLNKTFQQSDAGLWMFKPWQHDSASKTVNVSISAERVSTDVLSQTTKTSTTSISQSQMTETDVTSVALIIVLTFITLLAIVLTIVVWRHPGIITRLRGAPAIDTSQATKPIANVITSGTRRPRASDTHPSSGGRQAENGVGT